VGVPEFFYDGAWHKKMIVRGIRESERISFYYD